MDKQHQKVMLDLERLLQTQEFKSAEEMQAFVNKYLVGQTIPEFDRQALTPAEQAQDMVYEANQVADLMEAEGLVFDALQLDPECVEAYEFMGERAVSPVASLTLFKEGYTLAAKKLGEKFFQQNAGLFWGIHESRPYMRCLKAYGDCLNLLGDPEAALDVYLRMLELNPNDNQGVRDLAGALCLELNQLDQFEKLHQQFEDDHSAFHFFNHALFLFLTQGDTEISRAALQKAKSQNKHVLPLFTSRKELPQFPDSHGVGDKNEAIYYAHIAREVWREKPGAMEWLAKSVYKS
jgi:tetratricopeptide (TPR) repeat protein